MELTDLLRRVIGVLEEQCISYMLVGSMASSTYGRLRFTADIDIVVDLDAEQAEKLFVAFPAPEYYVRREAALEAVRLRRQFNIIHPASGGKVDLILARMDDWGRTQMARREKAWILPDCRGYMARPEDIIISKMRYYKIGASEKHLRDIKGILEESADKVDRAYVERWAEELGLKEIWDVVLKRLSESPEEE